MRSELTVKNYYTDIKLFLRFIKQENGLCKDEEFDEVQEVAIKKYQRLKDIALN